MQWAEERGLRECRATLERLAAERPEVPYLRPAKLLEAMAEADAPLADWLKHVIKFSYTRSYRSYLSTVLAGTYGTAPYYGTVGPGTGTWYWYLVPMPTVLACCYMRLLTTHTANKIR